MKSFYLNKTNGIGRDGDDETEFQLQITNFNAVRKLALLM